MVLRPLQETFTHLKHPVLWIPGLYAGIITALAIWLEFSGGEFIAGKILFLGAVIAPFFVGGALGCISLGEYTIAAFFRSAKKYYFPVLLPFIVAFTISLILLVLFSIPFAIAGLGSDASLIGGLFIGITVPVAIFAFFADNAAVAEGLTVLASLKQSMQVASRAFTAILSCIIISCFNALVLMLITSMIWGMLLADKFTGYLDLNMTEQQKIFSGYGLTEWQQTLGTDGIAATAIMAGLCMAVLVTFFVVFKHRCYMAAVAVEIPEIKQQGEFDEKGRWYKY